MKLEDIYKPIVDDLQKVEDSLRSAIREPENPFILSMSDSLLKSSGKRLRPAIVILSERASSAGGKNNCDHDELIQLAAATELIHMASLIHDDILDEAKSRRNKPSINAEFGDNISIIFGDFIYSKAFELIGKCRNSDLFECLCSAIYVMCEGELTQVCQRGNVSLSKEHYLAVIAKKTAKLFAVCCQAGAIAGKHGFAVQAALEKFGHNFGMAFQIIDDLEDILGEETVSGELSGQDIAVGDMTLPVLNLFELASPKIKKEIKDIFNSKKVNQNCLARIREMLVNSNAIDMTQKTALSYMDQARRSLDILENSDYKQSLNGLIDYITPKPSVFVK